MTVLVGDVHGEFERLKKLIYAAKDTVLQLGDLGIGFPRQVVNPAFFIDNTAPYMLNTITDFQWDRRKFVFIRGNHDNPAVCVVHKNYLGNFGVFKDMFYMSGAWSIDRAYRKEGVDWWPEEELEMAQCYDALEMYKSVKPDIVLTHDCPTSILTRIHSHPFETRTGQLLQTMLDEHKPKHWFFAHHHVSWQEKVNGVNFKCLNCLEAVRI